MRFSDLDAINIRNPSDADIERYNSQFAFAFLRGSNYLHPMMDWKNAPAVLKRLRIPIIAFGIGAQAPATGKLQLPRPAREVLDSLPSARSRSWCTRGLHC